MLTLSSAVLRSLSPLPRGKGGRGVGWGEPHFSSPAAPRCWLGRSYRWGLRSPGAHAVSDPAGGAEPGGAPRLGARQGTARGSLCSLPIPAELWFLFSSGDLGFWGNFYLSVSYPYHSESPSSPSESWSRPGVTGKLPGIPLGLWLWLQWRQCQASGRADHASGAGKKRSPPPGAGCVFGSVHVLRWGTQVMSWMQGAGPWPEGPVLSGASSISIEIGLGNIPVGLRGP